MRVWVYERPHQRVRSFARKHNLSISEVYEMLITFGLDALDRQMLLMQNREKFLNRLQRQAGVSSKGVDETPF